VYQSTPLLAPLTFHVYCCRISVPQQNQIPGRLGTILSGHGAELLRQKLIVHFWDYFSEILCNMGWLVVSASEKYESQLE
jgi:hypothetical protein